MARERGDCWGRRRLENTSQRVGERTGFGGGGAEAGARSRQDPVSFDPGIGFSLEGRVLQELLSHWFCLIQTELRSGSLPDQFLFGALT